MEYFEKIFDLLIALITGFMGFLVAKYTYNKNKPLDKLEIAYNRIYYPIYCLIKQKECSNDKLLTECYVYFLKYEKYIDNSTKIAYEYFKRNSKDKRAYKGFIDNIYSKNNYLRNRLGYMQSNFIGIYKYLSYMEKTTCRIVLEIASIYLLLAGYGLWENSKIGKGFLWICLFVFIIFFVEILVLFIRCFIRAIYWLYIKIFNLTKCKYNRKRGEK